MKFYINAHQGTSPRHFTLDAPSVSVALTYFNFYNIGRDIEVESVSGKPSRGILYVELHP